MNGKKVLVFGMARSGIAAAKLLRAKGAEVHITDAKSEADFHGALDELREGVVWHLNEKHPEALLTGMDALVISPGIPIEHAAVVRARELGVEVLGEVELAFRYASGLLLAVTGTNGKTTTCTLLGEICKNAGRRTHVVGNIGTPYAGIAAETTNEDVTVCEISSFQMESASTFHPRVSAVLNITEDHLNRHHTMENYIALKERIFANAVEGDSVVLNYDDPVTRDMANRAHGQVVFFSSRQAVPCGAFVREGRVVFGTPGALTDICAARDIYIPGEHNLQNALAATAMAMCAGISPEVIAETLRTFQGVEHRIEFVREFEGVRFINDSKGTNVDSTLWAVRAMDRPTAIILGGSEKASDFTPLAEELKHSEVRYAVLIGDTAKRIAATLDRCGFPHWEHAGYDFRRAIRRAFELAGPGGSVLLSPSCASFDMFSDYESRGRIFKEIVNALETPGA